MSSCGNAAGAPGMRRQQDSGQLQPTAKRRAGIQVTESSVGTSSVGRYESGSSKPEGKKIRKVASLRKLGSSKSSGDLSARFKSDVFTRSAMPVVPDLSSYQAFNLPRQHCRLQTRARWQQLVAPTLERCITAVAERDHICNIASLERSRMSISEPFALPQIRYSCTLSRFKHPLDPVPNQIPIPDLSLDSDGRESRVQLAKQANGNIDTISGILLRMWAPGTIAYTKIGSQWGMRETHQFPDIASANHDLAMRSNGKKAIVTIFCPSAAITSSTAYLVFATPGLTMKKGIDEAVERLLRIKPALDQQFEDRRWAEDSIAGETIDPKLDPQAWPTFGFDLLSPEVCGMLEMADDSIRTGVIHRASAEDMRQVSSMAATIFRRNAALMAASSPDMAWRVLPEGLPFLTAEEAYPEAEDQQQDMLTICAMTSSIGVTFTYTVDVHDKVHTTVHASNQILRCIVRARSCTGD
ncbi:hypothetical protein HD553DRAFT_327209 [Filobasidium floriforme]|uniref:uncharacterized protein n=1 Tax=Filobasidium floriforme TaxID=5210 RepID=UPI001E8EE674|nr:uncharacterized protein HD553DRAFT_327209 [Filobasidium floriforme]KAH8077701.1 hypothetical protein HD553DRAFT_327209 [Filobasidium floriforme]